VALSLLVFDASYCSGPAAPGTQGVLAKQVATRQFGILAERREIIVGHRLSMTAAAALMVCGAGATAAELPIYEVEGFPITPHQLVVLGPASAEQGLPASTITVAGMPASPHQIAVLTPRHKPLGGRIAGGGQQTTGQAGFSASVAIQRR
jgi:hypothetical protein